jgi:hypothetical protein
MPQGSEFWKLPWHHPEAGFTQSGTLLFYLPGARLRASSF